MNNYTKAQDLRIGSEFFLFDYKNSEIYNTVKVNSIEIIDLAGLKNGILLINEKYIFVNSNRSIGHVMKCYKNSIYKLEKDFHGNIEENLVYTDKRLADLRLINNMQEKVDKVREEINDRFKRINELTYKVVKISKTLI